MTERRLYIGGRFTGVTVAPDDRWPGMWRIHHGDRVSDMVNLSRAKDAAMVWAGLRGTDKPNWQRAPRDTGGPETARMAEEVGCGPLSLKSRRWASYGLSPYSHAVKVSWQTHN